MDTLKIFGLTYVVICVLMAVLCVFTGSPWSGLTCAFSAATMASIVDADDEDDELDLDEEIF
jgi:hypothetical protein